MRQSLPGAGAAIALPVAVFWVRGSRKLPGHSGPYRPERANRVSERAPAAGRPGAGLEAEKLRRLKRTVTSESAPGVAAKG